MHGIRLTRHTPKKYAIDLLVVLRADKYGHFSRCFEKAMSFVVTSFVSTPLFLFLCLKEKNGTLFYKGYIPFDIMYKLVIGWGILLVALLLAMCMNACITQHNPSENRSCNLQFKRHFV